MKRLIFCVLLLVILILSTTAGVTGPKQEPPVVLKAIEAANAKFMEAFHAHDAQAIANFYTENGEVLPPNMEIQEGREAIQAFWQAAFDMGIDSILLEIQEVDALGNTAIEVSHFTLYLADGSVADYGKYIVEWKRVSGVWYLHRDIFNTSQPLNPYPAPLAGNP
jgi:uncharacterized protein (TIGR02246 family)